MKNSWQIERALPSDADRLTEIALAAKRHWQYPERWIEIWRPALTITPDYITAQPVCAAHVDKVLVGFYGLLHKENDWWLEHLWVLPAHKGHGIGRALYEHALDTASMRGAAAIKIEADPYAEAFYLRMGAKRIGETVSTIEGRERRLPLLVQAVEPGPGPQK